MRTRGKKTRTYTRSRVKTLAYVHSHAYLPRVHARTLVRNRAQTAQLQADARTTPMQIHTHACKTHAHVRTLAQMHAYTRTNMRLRAHLRTHAQTLL